MGITLLQYLTPILLLSVLCCTSTLIDNVTGKNAAAAEAETVELPRWFHEWLNSADAREGKRLLELKCEKIPQVDEQGSLEWRIKCHSNELQCDKIKEIDTSDQPQFLNLHISKKSKPAHVDSTLCCTSCPKPTPPLPPPGTLIPPTRPGTRPGSPTPPATSPGTLIPPTRPETPTPPLTPPATPTPTPTPPTRPGTPPGTLIPPTPPETPTPPLTPPATPTPTPPTRPGTPPGTLIPPTPPETPTPSPPEAPTPPTRPGTPTPPLTPPGTPTPPEKPPLNCTYHSETLSIELEEELKKTIQMKLQQLLEHEMSLQHSKQCKEATPGILQQRLENSFKNILANEIKQLREQSKDLKDQKWSVTETTYTTAAVI